MKSSTDQAVNIFTKQYALAADTATKTAYLHGLAEIGAADKRVEKVVLDALGCGPEMISVACNVIVCTGLATDGVVGALTRLLLGNISQTVVADALAYVAGDNAIRIFTSLIGTGEARKTRLAIKSIVTAVRHQTIGSHAKA